MSARQSFFLSAAYLWALVLFSGFHAAAQSANIEFPTPAASNQISGTINARDLGDARLTTHYYVFEGTQGDIIIRVQTANFDGEIDVFNSQGLRPITKMSFISGTSLTESVREIYLRKSEKMILRVEGRSANDEAATYRIIFEGSFRPSTAAAEVPEMPEVKIDDQGAVRVNSVGTIIESRKENAEPVDEPPPNKTETKIEPNRDAARSDETEQTAQVEEPKNERAEPAVRTAPRKTAPRGNTRAARRPSTVTGGARRTPPAPKIETPDPLADVRIIVVLKEGETIEHPINQVQRFSVERGVLTIIMKTGRIVRVAVKDIAKMTVE